MSELKDFTGSCHCSNVRFSFSAESIEEGVRCTCSLCEKKGAMMSALVLDRDQLSYEVGDAPLSCYQFGTKVAKHYFCSHCGIYTFHEMRSQPGKMRVNLGCVDGVDVSLLDYSVFDGKNLLD